ncbi:unnamed protein product [Ceutorhynchus assimilis]|uniref:Uncharacterized protein n=1 Tax=Ceutorhynchus assimilis TaxID=467358 RepID=A0A9N9MNN6_9CUCU|nr:unnamed protein product [Ceutorhynchus assimilis]
MRDEYVKVRKGTSKSQYGPEYHLQMKFMDPHLPSVVSLLSSKSSIRGEKRNNNDDEETDSQSDDDQFDSTRTSASLKSVDKMNGLDLILLGVSKLMETYPQELSEVQSSMDEVDEICSLITKVIKQYAQSEPHLASPSISKFLMEQLANNGPLNQIENRVRARPSKVRKLTVRVKKELW